MWTFFLTSSLSQSVRFEEWIAWLAFTCNWYGINLFGTFGTMSLFSRPFSAYQRTFLLWLIFISRAPSIFKYRVIHFVCYGMALPILLSALMSVKFVNLVMVYSMRHIFNEE